MFEKIKKNLYFNRLQLLINKGIEEKTIVPFDEKFYEQMNHTYFNGIPISMHIRYLKPFIFPGKCDERSLYMFFCFEQSVLVRGDNKYLELKYGKEAKEHYWIEIGDYVYDPSLLMRFDKELYYLIFSSTNVEKFTKEKYCSQQELKEKYDDVRGTTIEDLKPGGKKYIDVLNSIPLVEAIAQFSGNQKFIAELNEHLSLIEYHKCKTFEEAIRFCEKTKEKN